MRTDHQHRFASVTDYLHHRPPYLMLDAIESIEPTRLVAIKRLTGEEYFLAGHFPGLPILPGAMMQEATTQAAGALIAANYNPMALFNTHDPQANKFALGVLVKVRSARFRSFARPGDRLRIEVDLIERVDELFFFRGSVYRGRIRLMRNEFELANIPTAVLRDS